LKQIKLFKMSNITKDETFDYYQEVARSAFADMLHDTERNRKYSEGLRQAIEFVHKKGNKAHVVSKKTT
jgi:type III protein arginine methyltransferase